jgi:hypothetical protein
MKGWRVVRELSIFICVIFYYSTAAAAAVVFYGAAALLSRHNILSNRFVS